MQQKEFMAIGEQTLQWFAAERAEAEPDAETGVATDAAASAVSATDVAAIVRQYSPLLYRVALSVLRSPAEAEDVVQDAFVRVLEHRAKVGQIVEPRAWLVRIAWNLALDRRRRIRPEQMDPGFTDALVSATMPADDAMAEAARMRRVLGAIDRLPAKEREALLLSAMQELTTAEIAHVLNRTESSVRSLLFRARTHLRERLGDNARAEERRS